MNEATKQEAIRTQEFAAYWREQALRHAINANTPGCYGSQELRELACICQERAQRYASVARSILCD